MIWYISIPSPLTFILTICAAAAVNHSEWPRSGSDKVYTIFYKIAWIRFQPGYFLSSKQFSTNLTPYTIKWLTRLSSVMLTGSLHTSTSHVSPPYTISKLCLKCISMQWLSTGELVLCLCAIGLEMATDSDQGCSQKLWKRDNFKLQTFLQHSK